MKIIHRKLGREKVYGLADNADNTIEIDSRLKGRKYLEIIIHEALHIYFPEKPETVILQTARKLANLLWRLQFRKVENSVR